MEDEQRQKQDEEEPSVPASHQSVPPPPRAITSSLSYMEEEQRQQNEEPSGHTSPRSVGPPPGVITSSLGALRPVLAQLNSLLDCQQSLPRGIRMEHVRDFKSHLQSALCSVEVLSKKDYVSITDMYWMKQVRDLSYEAQDYLDMARYYSVGGSLASCWVLTILKPQRHHHLFEGDISHLTSRLIDASKRHQELLSMKTEPNPEDHEMPVTIQQYEIEEDDVNTLTKQSMQSEIEEDDVNTSTKQSKQSEIEEVDVNTRTKQSKQSEIEEDDVNTSTKQSKPSEVDDNKLISLLSFDTEQQLKVVPILGTAGVGKTALVRRLYHSYGGRFQCRAFLCVSRRPTLETLLASMLAQIKGPQSKDSYNVDILIDNIKQHLRGKSYLIIVDDLWDTTVWEIISRAFPEGNYYSRVMTATEVEDVALVCCRYNSDHIYKMDPLSYDRQPGRLWLSNYEWAKEEIKQKFNGLPPHLKTCLLYLNMYQEGSVIKKGDLVRQWVAEGFINEENIENKEYVAWGYFNDLVTNGMIKPVDTNYNAEVLSCRVDQMVHDLIAYISKEENFISAVDYPDSVTESSDKVHRLSFRSGGARNVQMAGTVSISSVRSLMFSGFFKCIPSLVEYWLLRVLILHVWGDNDKTSLDLATIRELVQLRYLKIESNMAIKLPKIIRGLQYLQTLEVDAKVVVVPLDILSLQHLWHLHLPGNTYLPSKLFDGTLTSPNYPIPGLFNFGAVDFSKMLSTLLARDILTSLWSCWNAKGISHMRSLRSLSYFNLSNCSKYKVMELGDLTNLLDLHLTWSPSHSSHLISNIECFVASVLGKLRNLKSLVLDNEESTNRSIPCDGFSIIEQSSPPPNLEKLVLSPQILVMHGIPKWIGQLSMLCTLKIAVEKIFSDDIVILEGLSQLAALSLYVRTCPGGRIVFRTGEFPALKYFKFICTALCLEFEEQAMPEVQRMKLGFSANTMQQYSPVDAGFEHLEALKVISAKIGDAGADESSRESAKLKLKDAFRKNPSLIINVQFLDSSIYDETEQMSADVLTRGGQDEEYGNTENDLMEYNNRPAESRITRSLELSSHIHQPGWTSGRSRSGIRLLKTVRGFTYMVRQHMKRAGFRLTNELAFLDDDIERLTTIIDSNHGSLHQEGVLQLQDLVYDIEDFVDIYRYLRVRSRSHTLAHISHISQLKNRISTLREWQQSGVPSLGGSRDGTAQSRQSLSCPYANEDALVGIEEPMSEILELLAIPPKMSTVESEIEDEPLSLTTELQKLKVVTIVGYRGIGKTALASAAYNNRRVRDAFHRTIWVRASECNHGGDLLRKIWEQVIGQPNLNDAFPDLDRFNKAVYDSRFLIVIDDLQRAALWNDIQSFLYETLDVSRIIVTTSTQSVAAACSSGQRYIYRMQGLDNSNSKRLFWKRVGTRANCTPALDYALGDTLTKCGGLPLALLSAANYFGHKEQNLTQSFSGPFAEMNTVLTECYDCLPDNSHRMCLLSLSTYPQGQLIKRKRLIRRWVAEGLAIGDCEHSAEEAASNIFDVLVDRNIIEPVLIGHNSKAKGCVVLGVIKDFIVNSSVSREFATVVSNNELLFPNKKIARPARRLFVGGGTTHSERVVKGIGLDQVRSLTVCNTVPFDFQGCWLLRVLDLECCQGIDKWVLHNICELVLLKFLSLRGSDVYKIPQKIEKLECLEMLDVRETRVETLPIEVFMLPRLAHLFGKFELPRNLKDGKERSNMQAFFAGNSRLQTLSGFLMVENNGFESMVLNMRSLRKVKLWCNQVITLPSYQKRLVSSIQERLAGSNALESLSMDFGNESIDFLNKIRAPFSLISSMKLRGRLTSLPSFINAHDTTLSELQLSSTGLTVETLSLLQNLRRLLYLKLHDADGFPSDSCFVVQISGFPSLLHLWFESPMLPQIHIHKGGMSSLTSLQLLCPAFASCNSSDTEESCMKAYSEKSFNGVDSSQKLKGVGPKIIEDVEIEETAESDSEKRSKETFQSNYCNILKKTVYLKKQFRGIEHLQRLNELVLHPYVSEEVMNAWKEEGRSHVNKPKVARQSTSMLSLNKGWESRSASTGQGIRKEEQRPQKKQSEAWKSTLSMEVVHHLTGRLQRIIRALLQRISTTSRNFMLIRDGMKMMASFLEDVQQKNIQWQLLEKWILQLQDLVNDIDDFVDMNINCLPRKGPPAHADVHIPGLSGLKGRLDRLYQRGQGWIIESAKREGTVPLSRPLARSLTTSTVDNELVVIWDSISEVLELVPHEDGLCVISVVGCPGVGKTTLAKAVFVRSDFDVKVWVPASECSTAKDLLIMIIKHASDVINAPATGKSTSDDYNMMPESTILGHLQYILALRRRLFIIIDDLCLERSEVKKLREALNANWNYDCPHLIIVTTSIQYVADSLNSGGRKGIYRMKGLGHRESKNLFCGSALGRAEASLTPDQEYALEETLRRCDGLPLAVINAADIWREQGWTERFYEYQPVPYGAFEKMNRALVRWYKNWCLATFMPSLSVFPSGHLIKKNSLVRKWAAQGLVLGEDGDSDFTELIDQFVIEPVVTGNNSKVKRCVVRGPMLEFIVRESISNNFVTLIRGDKPSAPFLGEKSMNTTASVLSVHGTVRVKRVEAEIRLDRVRSLTIFDGWAFRFQRCTYLRVLDLEGCNGVNVGVIVGICELVLLRYLSLRGSDVQVIPYEIQGLRCLETLDIRETGVNILPREAIMLPQLVHLFGKFDLSKGLKSKVTQAREFFQDESKLQTLSGFVMDGYDSYEDIVLDMRLLKKVKIWCTEYIDKQTKDRILTSLEKRLTGNTALESLSIDFYKNKNNMGNDFARHFDYKQGSSGPCMLRSFKLRGRLGGMLPKFIISAANNCLSELQLSCTGLWLQDLSTLQSFGLLYLKLAEDSDDGFLGTFMVEKDGFPRLKRLCFEATKPPRLQITEGAMPALTSLHLLSPPVPEHRRDMRVVLHEEETTSEIEQTNRQWEIKYLKSLNDLVLHSSVSDEELDFWKEKARRHMNRPKVTRQLMP